MTKRFKDAISSDGGIQSVFVVQCVITLISVVIYLKYGHQWPRRRIFLWRMIQNPLLRYQEQKLHRLWMELNTTVHDDSAKAFTIDEVKISVKANDSTSPKREYSLEADLLGSIVWLNTKSQEKKKIETPLQANSTTLEDERMLEPRSQSLPVFTQTISDDQVFTVSALNSGEGLSSTAAEDEKLVTLDDIATQQEVIDRGNQPSTIEDQEMAIESATPTLEATTTMPTQDDNTYGTGPPTTSAVAEIHNPQFGKAKTAMVRSRHRLRNKFDTIAIIPDADFTTGEMDVIDRFMQTLHRFLAEFGLNLPRLSSELVSAQTYGKEHSLPETYICIIGFTAIESVKEFDSKLSKPENRLMYQPLKLCYLLDRINRSAAPEMFIIETSQNVTYCGSLMISELEHDAPFVSTVGGLITIREKTYALTTNHPPEEEQHQLSKILPQIHQKERFTFGPEDVFDCGAWRLALIQPDHRRPNVILQSSSDSEALSYTPKAIESHYPINSRIFSGLRDVLIVSGRSGIKEGILSKRRTFMLSESRHLQEVWSIDLGFDDFQPGDSGSWVIHKSDSSVMGILIARSTNCGYMVPFEQVQEDIGTTLKVPTHEILPLQQPSSVTERTNFTVETQLNRLIEHTEVENFQVASMIPSKGFLRIISKMLELSPIKRLLSFSAQLYSRVGVTWLGLCRGLLTFFMLIKTMLMPQAFVVFLVFLYFSSGAITAWELAKPSETAIDHFEHPHFIRHQGTQAISSWLLGLLLSACVLRFDETYGWLETASAWVKSFLLISIYFCIGLYALPSKYAFMDRPLPLATRLTMVSIWLHLKLYFIMVSIWLHFKPYFTRSEHALGTESERQSVDTGQLSSAPWIDKDGQVVAPIKTEPKWKKSTKYMLIAMITTVMGICVADRALTGTWDWPMIMTLINIGIGIAALLIPQDQYNLAREGIPFTGGVVAGASGDIDMEAIRMMSQTYERDSHNQSGDQDITAPPNFGRAKSIHSDFDDFFAKI